jgi:hypothetical protein
VAELAFLVLSRRPSISNPCATVRLNPFLPNDCPGYLFRATCSGEAVSSLWRLAWSGYSLRACQRPRRRASVPALNRENLPEKHELWRH